MKVRCHLFAQLRDVAGVSAVEVELAEASRISDLLKELYRRFPRLGEHDKSILVGSGVEFVNRDYVLKPGEEISVMPPVQGG